MLHGSTCSKRESSGSLPQLNIDLKFHARTTDVTGKFDLQRDIHAVTGIPCMLHKCTCNKRQSSGSRGRAGCICRLRRLRGRQPRTRRRLGALSCADTSISQHMNTASDAAVHRQVALHTTSL